MEKIADLLTKFMISESSSENLDYEVCKFGLLMAIEVAINTVIALCISFLLGMFRYGILFLTFFSLLRAFAGGVHLERFWSCTVLSGMVLSMVLLIAKYAVIPSIFSFALCVVMGILIFIVGPIDDKNRRISSDERCIFYRRLVYVLLFLVFTSALGVILDANRLAFIVSLTMGVFHIVQIIGKNKNMKLLEQNAIYEKQISLFQEQIYVKETAMLNDKMVRDKFYHQLSFIKELVYQRELSQLNEFIDGIMQNKKIEKDGPANSGNVLLDYIVNNKCEIAVKQGIECTVKIEVPYKFPFSDGDIFIILGNALDNAIEGALKCVSRRYIHIKIIYRKENLFIKISNSFDGKVKKDRHGHLISMKSDLTRYGLGLALIEKSVNKYNGLLNFDIDEENFTLTVLLYS